jgi:DHA1 family bicyclomycin/chloramphenicol resistance-like MFS transporter
VSQVDDSHGVRTTTLGILVFALGFASQLPITIFLPAVPQMATWLRVGVADIQLIVPAYLGAFAVAQLAAGPVSDATGRRRVTLAGMALFTLASIACALANDLALLIAARAAQAIGACVAIVVGRAIVRDTLHGLAAARAMAWIAISMGVGPSLAPFAGGYLTAWFDWRATFVATGLCGGAILVLTAVMLPETLPPAARQITRAATLLHAYAQIAANRAFMRYTLTVSFISSAFNVFLVGSPEVVVGQMGVSPEQFGFLVMLVPVTFMAGSYLSNRLALLISIDRIIFVAALVALSGGLWLIAMALNDSATAWLLFAAVMLFNGGNGVLFPLCYGQALNTVPPALAGSASALAGFIHMAWGFTIALATTAVPQYGTGPMGLMMAASIGIGLLAFLLVGRRAARRDANP